MSQSDNKACFAALALGAQHVFHARQLATDLEFFAPDHSLLVLSDHPSAFRSHPNVTAIRHHQKSVFRCFHDKRFLIEASLDLADICIVIDSNIRILAPISAHAFEYLDKGISAAHLYSIESKWTSDENNQNHASSKERLQLNREKRIVGQALNAIGIKSQDARFPQEYLYAIRRADNHSQIKAWLGAWADLAHYFDFHRLPWSEGFGIGIAAAATETTVECLRILPDSGYYKERTHRFNLKTFRNPVSREQEHCHAQQTLINETFHSPRFSGLLTRVKQLARFGTFRLQHWSDRHWLDALRLTSQSSFGKSQADRS